MIILGMSLQNLMNHTCDVYHIVKESASPGFGLPGSPVFSYPDTPDIAGQICHFNVKGNQKIVQQTEPAAVYNDRVKLVYPLGTDIRLNDKIVNTANGLTYSAEMPVQIRDHHMFVMLRRTTEQEKL